MGTAEVIRINADESDIVSVSVTAQDAEFEWNGRLVRTRDIETVWYRKGRHWISNVQEFNCRDTLFEHHVRRKLEQERVALSDHLHSMIERLVPTLGSTTHAVPNKLFVLCAARSVGLAVPEFRIISSRAELVAAFNSHTGWITKAISDAMYFFDTTETERGYFTYTETLTADVLTTVAETFSPSMLQVHIEKKYDIRIFFLDSIFYSMAILSQSDDQTRVDCRKYNVQRPNRCVPYQLPIAIETKLRALLANLNLNTASIDMIHGQDNNYYFLEVNPVGQFEALSSCCNYYLEQKIADRLGRAVI